METNTQTGPVTSAHVYAGGTHDRAAIPRRDSAWLNEAFSGPSARFLPIWRDLHLIDAADSAMPALALLPRDTLGFDPAHGPSVFLGLRNETPVFAVDISTLDEAVLPGAFVPVRPLAAMLSGADTALIAQARSLLSWRAANRFCGRCGVLTSSEDGGARLRCSANADHLIFPRVDPVVIMLVRDNDRALLAQGTRFPPERRLFSALAGFVEPGESAEEAVAREVFEETGIRITNIRYHSSQPWPYPGALMLGFMADAVTTDLAIDTEEIVEARWVTRDEIRDPSAHAFEIPGPAAIAHHLISAWRDGRD
jgi:NAD+ diphosphatase